MEEKYVVKSGSFEGPLDLLLLLIENKKLEINDITLSEVADSFIEYIGKIDKLPIKESAHFILVASTLVLIKSLSLIPKLQLTSEEEESIEELENRLFLYKKVKEISLDIEKKFAKEIIFKGRGILKIEYIFSPTKEITLENIHKSISDCILSLPVFEKKDNVSIKKVISLEEIIESLTDRVRESMEVSFKKVSNFKGGVMNKEEKINVIVNFLAILELVKKEIIEVIQRSEFNDIEMTRNKEELVVK